MELESYMTSDSASSYDSCDSLSTLSSNNSDASHSPDRAIDGRCEHHSSESTVDSFCKMCLARLRSSFRKPDCSSKSVPKTKDEISGNIVGCFDGTTDTASSGSSTEKNSKVSPRSFEDTSSEDGISNKRMRKKQKKNSPSSCSKGFDSDPEKGVADPEAADSVDPHSTRLTEKHSVRLISPVSELHTADETLCYKTSSSNDLASKEADKSSMEEKGGVHSRCSRQKPMRKPVPKRKK